MGDTENPEAKSRSFRWLSLALRVLVATLAMLWVISRLDGSELKAVFQDTGVSPFLLTLLVFALSQVLSALRWWILLRAQGIRIPLLLGVRLHYVGLFYNNLMISSVGGDFLRAWYVTKHTDKGVEAALSVFADRILGLLGLVIMAVFAYLFLLPSAPASPTETAGPESGPLGIALKITAYAGVGLAAIFILTLLIPACRRALKMLVAGAWSRGKQVFRRIWRALALYGRTPWALVQALTLTMVLQSMVIAVFWYLGEQMGMGAGLHYYFVIFPATWVLGALPISIAGLGVLEGGIVELFVHLADTTPEHAAVLAISQRVIWILNSLPGAGIHLAGGHLPGRFSFDATPKAG